MTIPLLISVIVAGASTLYPPKNQNGSNGASSAASCSAGASGFPGIMGNQMFLAGIVMGMSLSWVLASELHRSRLHDRIRLTILGWLKPLLSQSSEDDTPVAGRIIQLIKEENGHGESNKAVSTILSPGTSLTSNLWISTIRIPPQQELQLQKANGLEFFFVLKGKGEWDIKARNGDDNGCSENGKPLAQGDAFAIEANSSRWIANASSLEDLVLLRSSDAGFNYCQKGYDQIVPRSASRNAISSSISAMVRQARDNFNSIFFGNTSGNES